MSITKWSSAGMALATSIVFTTLGCSGDPSPPTHTESKSAAVVVHNGWKTNGWKTNGWKTNGWKTNGWKTNGFTQGGIPLENVTLNGSTLEVPAPGTIVGSQITVDVGEEHWTLRIDGVRQQDDISFYTVSSLNDNNQWEPLCVDANDNPVEAIVLGGYWNYEEGVPGGGSHTNDPLSFTLACRGYVLAKCAEWGYKPWLSSTLADRHQACTRMVRADYCGNGVSWTYEGTSINVFDDQGVEIDTESWLTEAEWDTNGARCTVANMYRKATPPCFDSLISSNCGDASHFSSGTMFISERPTSGPAQ